MSGHYHCPNAPSQNVGNSLGARSSVRQSKLYRKYESGNGMKEALGVSHLAWDEHNKQGAYAGHAVWDADTGRPTHTRHPPARRPHESAPEPYHPAPHGRTAARAPPAEYGRMEMPPSYASAAPAAHGRYRDEREPMPQPSRRPYPGEMDAYDRHDSRPYADTRRGSFGEPDTRAPLAAYDRTAYPERGYEHPGYTRRPSHKESSHDRLFGGPEGERPRHEAPRSYSHHPAPEPTRPMPSGYGAYDAPPPMMRSRGENENISNLTGAVGGSRSSYDRDLEYAALNAKVSDVEKRMVRASKTRPW